MYNHMDTCLCQDQQVHKMLNCSFWRVLLCQASNNMSTHSCKTTTSNITYHRNMTEVKYYMRENRSDLLVYTRNTGLTFFLVSMQFLNFPLRLLYIIWHANHDQKSICKITCTLSGTAGRESKTAPVCTYLYIHRCVHEPKHLHDTPCLRLPTGNMRGLRETSSPEPLWQ